MINFICPGAEKWETAVFGNPEKYFAFHGKPPSGSPGIKKAPPFQRGSSCRISVARFRSDGPNAA
jgi:hypothetical protein